MTREEAIELIHDIQTDAVYSILPEEKEALDMAISALSENKGDFEGMTNGEVIQALFPNCVTRIDNDGWFITNIDGYTEFTPEWWNAPYQKGGE